jgi:hypothetical protein
VSPALRERAAAMVERVTLECNAVRIGDVASVREAVGVALAVRDRLIDHDHDPRYLHPGRTVLILISDGAVRDAQVLAAAAFVESLPGDPQADPSCLHERARALLEEVPLPDESDDDLLERLITARHEAGLIAIAERLDHARHLHVMRDVEPTPFIDQIDEVYVPAAWRISQKMAGRLERWSAAYRRRRVRLADQITPRGDASDGREG